MGFTLWIVPSATDAKIIQDVMHHDLTTGSAAASPHPHITLASGLPETLENNLDILRSLIPQQEKPLKCGFASIDIGDAYFRSVYIVIKATEQVLALHKQVHENLRIEKHTPIFPHLSLVYITNEAADKGERTKFYDYLKNKKKFKETWVADEKRVSLNNGSELEKKWMDSFDATEIWAVKCDGPVESWEVKAKYPLIKV